MLTQSRQAPYLILHAPGKSILARWNQDRPAIQAAFDNLAGAGGISLSPWFNHPDPNLGIPMSFDFAPVFAAIRAAGFNWVQIAPQFYTPTGASDARVNGMNVFQAHWLAINGIHTARVASGLEGITDAVPEFNDFYSTNPSFASYVRAMWANVTLTSAPGGVPCWPYSMSFVPRDLDCLESAFQGNWPAILLPHIYSNEPSLPAVQAELPGPYRYRPVILGETDTLEPGDEAVPASILGDLARSQSLVMRVCPWPITPRWRPGDSMVTVYPVRAQAIWNGAGA